MNITTYRPAYLALAFVWGIFCIVYHVNDVDVETATSTLYIERGIRKIIDRKKILIYLNNLNNIQNRIGLKVL